MNTDLGDFYTVMKTTFFVGGGGGGGEGLWAFLGGSFHPLKAPR